MKRVLTLTIAIVLMLVLSLSAAGCSDNDKRVVTLLNWGEYLDPDLLIEFNENHDDFDVVEKRLTSNEEMYAILSTEGH